MRRIYLALLPLCLAGCDPTSVTDSPTGTYVEEKDITQTGDPDFLTKGCDAHGNAVLQIDSRLKVGTTLGQVFKIRTDGVGIGDVDFSTKVTTIANGAINEKYTVNKVTNFSGCDDA